MFRFSIRNVLWLTVVVAALTAWWLDRVRMERESAKALEVQAREIEAKTQALEVAAKTEKHLRRGVELLSQMGRNNKAVLEKREAELKDSLDRREAVIEALRIIREAPSPAAENPP